jgi:hypothetical protein
MKRWLLVIAVLFLFAAELLRVYFIMPFPGSQRDETIDLAYFIHRNIWFIRIASLLLIAFSLRGNFSAWNKKVKIFWGFIGLLYLIIFYLVNFKFLADKMFYQPENKLLANSADSKINMSQLIIGVSLNNEAKAYPLEIIGYHHQVQDTVGGRPVMVTYCTVCRTGRVFSPMINGKKENFRLVGMDHFNAMFEDETTKSWWRQSTGEAITGPLKGKRLEEIPSTQAGLASWLQQYPNSLVLQPDPVFKKQYDHLAGFDKGTIKSSLEKRDSASWQFKSWVIGIKEKDFARAYDWNELVEERFIHDSLPGLPLVIYLEPDNVSFHAWNRKVNNTVLRFISDNDLITDKNTGSSWNYQGVCIAGPMKDARLIPIQASQEFWHSWKYFQPNTSVYKK